MTFPDTDDRRRAIVRADSPTPGPPAAPPSGPPLMRQELEHIGCDHLDRVLPGHLEERLQVKGHRAQRVRPAPARHELQIPGVPLACCRAWVVKTGQMVAVGCPAATASWAAVAAALVGRGAVALAGCLTRGAEHGAYRRPGVTFGPGHGNDGCDVRSALARRLIALAISRSARAPLRRSGAGSYAANRRANSSA
jgi:hypothetical protein